MSTQRTLNLNITLENRELRIIFENLFQKGIFIDIISLKYLFVAGEHCDQEARNWAQGSFGVPVLGDFV